MNGKLSVAFCLLAPGSASPEWLFYDIISSCFWRVFGSLLYLSIHLTYTCLILSGFGQLSSSRVARETRSRRKCILSKQTPRSFASCPVLVDPFPSLADPPSLE
ncbi:hypothetical protein E4T42_01921 [Aureobasidium subglaciale]|nr:hypothetical protein E4T42_01921 [Aureobasidium subglaciale]